MGKIEILGKTIGKVQVIDCLGGKPLRYSCIGPCGDKFTATSQMIRSKKIDCGCGLISGIHNKPFKVGDVYHDCKILDVFKKYEKQTCYSFICGICGEKCERTHSDFIKKPICPKCLKKKNDDERDKKIYAEFAGKEVNGIKILRLSGREKSVLYVDAVCPVCGEEFRTSLARIKIGINSCRECAKINLQKGYEIAKGSWVDGTSILSIKPGRSLNKNSTTGHKGVSIYQDGRYRAYINFKRKQYHLGLFHTLDEAIRIREIAEKKVFGDFLKWYAEEFPEKWERISKNGDKGI